MRPFLLLFILLGFPVLEIFSLIRLSELIGWWWLAWVLVDVVLGVALIRAGGFEMPVRLFAALNGSQSPTLALFDSFRTVLAGLLLIFPGLFSDLLALVLLLLPRPRVRAARGPADDGVIEGEWRRETEQDRIGRRS
jgi:UPF0716 protein FxsA